MTRHCVLVSALGASLLCSCAAPRYQTPATERVVSWATNPDADSAWPTPTWWVGFNSAELNDLITRASADNHGLRAAALRIVQAEAQAEVAGAPRFPSLKLDGSVSDQSDRYQAGLSASYQLDLFGEIRSSAASASQRLQSSRYDRQTVALTLYADVAAAYFQVLFVRDRLRLAKARLENIQRVLKLIETQKKFGYVSGLEVTQQRTAFVSQQAAIPELRQAERIALNTLALLLARAPENFQVLGNTLSGLTVPAATAGMPSGLLQRRPDVRKAESDLKASNYDIGAAVAARFPSIQLSASGSSASDTLRGLLGAGTFAYSLGASLTEPLFDGGRLQAQEKSARARNMELAENYGQIVIAAFTDAENALSAVEHNQLQYEFVQEAYTLAQQSYRIAENRYRAGTSDFLTVLDAQRTLFQAEDSLTQAILARFSAAVGLYKALGGGWDGVLPTIPGAQLMASHSARGM